MGLKFVMYGELRSGSDTGVGSSLYEVYSANTDQTDFGLAGSYRVGVHELEVYLNGVRQLLDVDYTEVDTKTIRFTAPLDAGDVVMFNVTEIRNTSLHAEYSAIVGQTTFVLSKPYRIGMNTLQVYQNGMLLRLNDDYQETNDTTVTFTYPLDEGAKITFKEVV